MDEWLDFFWRDHSPGERVVLAIYYVGMIAGAIILAFAVTN